MFAEETAWSAIKEGAHRAATLEALQQAVEAYSVWDGSPFGEPSQTPASTRKCCSFPEYGVRSSFQIVCRRCPPVFFRGLEVLGGILQNQLFLCPIKV